MKDSNTIKFSQRWMRSLQVVVLITLCIMFGTAIARDKNMSSSNSIVGFWHVELLLPDGSLFHQGIQQYHSDGLEMEDAAAPAVNPANFCMGVCKQSGDTVNIYHIVFMYNGSDTLPPVNYGELTETNILSVDGNSLNGTFEIKVYDLNTGNHLVDVNGTIKASRIDFEHPFTLFSPSTGINNEMHMSTNYTLSQNYPNPFNPTTTINYSIPKAERVTIKVYDILGKLVQTLVDEAQPMGTYHVKFSGSNLSSGVYFYQIKTDNFVEAKRMIILK
ncbi:MAG: T9SS type A sorting domain-containing protein [Ignavibacteriaceae bacterium]